MNDSERNERTADIVVPCCNEEKILPAFFEETVKVTDTIEGWTFRFIFVDDGSSDLTLERIKDIKRDNEGRDIGYISFSRNFGKEAAMYAGMERAGGDYVLVMDADLQHPPALIREMAYRIEKTGCDCCAARRVSRKGEPRIRSFFARAFYRMMNRYSDIDLADGAVDFRLMSRRMVKAVLSVQERQRFSKGIFAWVGFHTEWVEFENVKRMEGESKWSMWALMKYAMEGFLDFADSPLKAAGVLGGLTAVFSAIYFIIEFMKTVICGKDIPGYASTVCLILFFGGLVITILSLMGEYLGRIYMETKRRPLYIEKESDRDEEKDRA